MGLSALYFLLFQAMALSQRKYVVHRAFIMVWVGFAFCLGMLLLLPLLLIQFKLPIDIYPASIIFSQWLISILAYIPMHYLLSKLNKLIE